ncbi:MAG: hypothetical protein ACKOAL_07185, partial [Chthoniobacterales bacterium]
DRDLALRQAASDYIVRLGDAHGVPLRLDGDALEALVALSVARQPPVRDLCAELFRNYEFGLRLLRGSPAGHPLVLTRAAVDSPDKFLSDLVVGSYRGPSQQNETPADPAP